MSFKDLIEGKIDGVALSALKKQMSEAMDPVDKKALKKDFDDRDDKDIDNDGDVDDSDEYLHKRRKAVSKAVTKEDIEEVEEVNMGPWNRGAINGAMKKAGIKGPQAKAFIAALRGK